MARSLKALVVFRNLMHSELIRSVHVYPTEGGREKLVEREYMFNQETDYKEVVRTNKLFTLNGFDVSQYFERLAIGDWACIFVFDVHRDASAFTLNQNALLSGNPKLESIPTLANEIRMISESINPSRMSGDDNYKLGYTRNVPDLDLNSLPPTEFDNEATDQSTSDVRRRKYKRTRSEYVAKISFEDVAKYFDVPIREAAKRLHVGLSVLKKKCRKFGIPRWPHRKIKSLDSLLRDIQEEAENNKEDEETKEIVAIKESMVKSEKENIEKRPFLDLQTEIKIIRQDHFKRRHIARVQEIESRTIKFF